MRQGEDRKASVEDTQILSSKINEVKLSQKRHKEQLIKVIRSFAHMEGNLKKTNNYVDLIR